MKHGDQAKAKSAKAKASPAKSSSKAVAVEKSRKAAGEGSKAKSSTGKTVVKKSAAAAKAGPKAEDNGGGKPKAGGAPAKVPARSAPAPDSEGFTNPVIAGAFKHALKKYSNAFRKLTD